MSKNNCAPYWETSFFANWQTDSAVKAKAFIFFSLIVAKINSVISLWNTGAVTGNERDSSHGYFRLSDGSRWLGSPVSSRDSLMPNISDSGGYQSGQRILRYHLYGKTTPLPITLLQVWFTCLRNISIEIKDQVLSMNCKTRYNLIKRHQPWGYLHEYM